MMFTALRFPFAVDGCCLLGVWDFPDLEGLLAGSFFGVPSFFASAAGSFLPFFCFDALTGSCAV